MDGHAARKAAESLQQINGDEIGFANICPDACRRLDVFIRERFRESTAVEESGLLEAAEEIARVLQRVLHDFHASKTALTMDQARECHVARNAYLSTFLYLGPSGNRFAKELERRAAPNGQALAICLGSMKRYPVQTLIGEIPMHGYAGCLRTFPDPPHGPGRRWPRFCPSCRPARSNARNAAVTALHQRVAIVQGLARTSF
jgi:hypothetical protein